MPKMKTHKGAKKRFKITATGKVRHRSCNTGHLMSGKSGNRRRKLRTPRFLKNKMAYTIRRALGDKSRQPSRPPQEGAGEASATL